MTKSLFPAQAISPRPDDRTLREGEMLLKLATGSQFTGQSRKEFLFEIRSAERSAGGAANDGLTSVRERERVLYPRRSYDETPALRAKLDFLQDKPPSTETSKVFDSDLRREIQAFQRKHKLRDRSGIVGPETMAAIDTAVGVKKLQIALNSHGNSIGTDGILGPETRNAIKSSQLPTSPSIATSAAHSSIDQALAMLQTPVTARIEPPAQRVTFQPRVTAPVQDANVDHPLLAGLQTAVVDGYRLKPGQSSLQSSSGMGYRDKITVVNCGADQTSTRAGAGVDSNEQQVWLIPEAAVAFRQMMEARGKAITDQGDDSSFRTSAQQNTMIMKARQGSSEVAIANPEGSSLHQYALAFDASHADFSWLLKNASAYGFVQVSPERDKYHFVYKTVGRGSLSVEDAGENFQYGKRLQQT